MTPPKPNSIPGLSPSTAPLDEAERQRLIRKLNEELEIGMRELRNGEGIDADAVFAELEAELADDRNR